MFHSSDLALRRAAAVLPSRFGYALTRRLTPLLGGERRRWIGSRVRQSVHDLLADESLATAAAERFVSEMACDDLDAVTSLRWSEEDRLSATTVEGAQHLPRTGPAVVTSFHFSGGFRVFDVLRSRGLAATFLHAPPRDPMRGYDAAIHTMRAQYFRRHLNPPFIEPGPGARERLHEHLDRGGVVVALLDVAPGALDLRDHVACTLLGRPLRLPIGLLRLAARHGAPVVSYDGRIENDRRTLSFHAAAHGNDPEGLLRDVLRTCESVIRARPWTWQAWLEAEVLFTGGRPRGPEGSFS